MKSRQSFIKSITNRSIRAQIVQPYLDNESKQQPVKVQDDIQEQSNSRKRWFNLSSSFEVSFNLDKLYFDDELKEEVKEENQSVKKQEDLFPDLPPLDCLNQEQQIKDLIPIQRQDTQKVEDKNILEKRTQNSIYEKAAASFENPKHTEPTEESHISEELDRTISIQKSKAPDQLPIKDQEIQVDFPFPEDQESTGQFSHIQSPEKLSEIDMLLIQPENMSRYNKFNPLIVSIEDLAKVYPLDLKLYECVQLDPFLDSQKQINMFEAFMQDWKKSETRSSRKSLTLAKMRTLIIRDAMNTLVDIIVPPKDNEDYHLRISKTYRSRYLQAGIQIPPPRVNNSYLESIFSKPKIKKFYIKYLEERLEIFLQEENFRRIEIYTLEIIKSFSLAENKTIQELTAYLKSLKKPFTLKELQYITKEAHQIVLDYGNAKKRIGNGHDKKTNGMDTQAPNKREFDGKISSKGLKTQKKVKIETETKDVFDKIWQKSILEKNELKKEQNENPEKLEWKQCESNIDKMKNLPDKDSVLVEKILTESQSLEEAQNQKNGFPRSFAKKFSTSFARGMRLQ